MFGRLAAGVPLADVGAALRHDHGRPRARADRPRSLDGEWLEPIPGTENFRSPHQRLELRTILSLLAGLTFMVLIVAATNLGNLALARASGRARELGVRIALGARRSRIVRQLVVETLPLALLGTALGLLVAWWATLVLTAATNLPTYLNFTPDWRTVLSERRAARGDLGDRGGAAGMEGRPTGLDLGSQGRRPADLDAAGSGRACDDSSWRHK